MTKKCALLNCDCDDSTLTLNELVISNEDEDVRLQASLLISKFHFKPTDIICSECFWK